MKPAKRNELFDNLHVTLQSARSAANHGRTGTYRKKMREAQALVAELTPPAVETPTGACDDETHTIDADGQCDSPTCASKGWG